MKLLISAAFGQLVAGQSTVPIPLPTQLSSLGDFLGGAGASIFGATDMSKVVNHGCHCKKFGNWDAPNQGGQPVDALDAICKQFWERRSCIKLSGGTCTSYHTSGGSYPEPQYIATAYLVDGAPVISPDVNFHCQAVTNPCSRDICEIDHATILQIVGGGHGTASHNWDFTNQCVGGRGIPNVDLPSFTCVGSGADATWAYRADIPTQLEHANDFFQQTAALKFFGDVAFTKIMDHGCHCKKLGDHDAEIQGGSTTVDDLDKRCKDFFMKRQCLKSNTGFSGSCSGGYPADSYQGALRVTDVERVSNGDQFPGMFEWFSDRQQHCSNLEEGSCLYDICNVDHDSIYGLIAAGQFDDSYNYIEATSCVEPVRQAPKHRVCTGHVPDIRFTTIDSSTDHYALVAGMLVDSYPDSVRNRLSAATGLPVDTLVEKLKAGYYAGRSAVSNEELEALKQAIDNDDSVAVNQIIHANKQQLGVAMEAIKSEFGSNYPAVELILVAYRMGHMDGDVDLYEVAVGLIMAGFDAEIRTQLKAEFGDDIMDRIQDAYALGRSVVDGEELRQIYEAAQNGDLQTVQNLLQGFFTQYAQMPEVIASFGDDWIPMQNMIRAYRLGHLENGVDLYEEAVGFIMAGFDASIRQQLSNAFGSDIMDRIEQAYALGRAVVDREELLQIHNAAASNDLVTVQALLQDFMSQYAQMPEVIASFGDDWIPMQNMIRAYRLGHLENGVDLYEEAVGFIMAGFDASIRQQLSDAFGSDIMDRIEQAYALGRAVVDREELLQIHNAAASNDLVTVQALLQDFMSQYAQMPEVIASFGDDWIPMQNMIRAYRLGHLENGVDLYEEAVGFIMAGFDASIRQQLSDAFGSDIMDRIEQAYALGRAVVDREELLQIHNAAVSNDLVTVQALLQDFMSQYAQMPEVIASFGDDWIPMQNMIRAYRLGHLENGVDLYEEAVGFIMAGFDASIRQQLSDAFGSDIMDRIEQAYALGRAVVDREELLQIHNAAASNDLVTVQALLQDFMSQYAQMPEVIASFGDDWIPMQNMIRAYRLGHLENGVDLYEEAVGFIMAGFDASIRQQLSDAFGSDIMDRIEQAYALGRAVVDREELLQIHNAAASNDLVTVQALLQDFMSQYAQMPEVIASFGDDWIPMQNMIRAYRLDHLENGVDLYEEAVGLIMAGFDADITQQLQDRFGSDIMDRIRSAYALGRAVVDREELLQIHTAATNNDQPAVQALLQDFMSQYAQMPEVIASFGDDWAPMQEMIANWRMGL